MRLSFVLDNWAYGRKWGWRSVQCWRRLRAAGCRLSRSLTCADCGAEVEHSFPAVRRPAGRTTLPAHPAASTMTALQDRHRGRRRGLARRRQGLCGRVAARVADSRLDRAWWGADLRGGASLTGCMVATMTPGTCSTGSPTSTSGGPIESTVCFRFTDNDRQQLPRDHSGRCGQGPGCPGSVIPPRGVGR